MYFLNTTHKAYKYMPFPKMQQRIETIAKWVVGGALLLILLVSTQLLEQHIHSLDLFGKIAVGGGGLFLILGFLYVLTVIFFCSEIDICDPNTMIIHGFWGGSKSTSLLRARHVIFWLSISPSQTHRFQSVAGAIQYHDHKRLNKVMSRKWFQLANTDHCMQWVRTACLANNTTAARMIEPVARHHLRPSQYVLLLLSFRTTYAYHTDDIQNFSQYRLQTVEHLFHSMSEQDIRQAYEQKPLLNELWDIYFPISFGPLKSDEIAREQKIADIALILAQHGSLHDFLLASMEEERNNQENFTGGWKGIAMLGVEREAHVREIRQEMMKTIQSFIQSQQLLDALVGTSQSNLIRRRRM